jgi:hypothetical protein
VKGGLYSRISNGDGCESLQVFKLVQKFDDQLNSFLIVISFFLECSVLVSLLGDLKGYDLRI